MATTTSANVFEFYLGRSLACCVHPYAAWRVKSKRVRAGIVAGYIAAGYFAGFVALLVIG